MRITALSLVLVFAACTGGHRAPARAAAGPTASTGTLDLDDVREVRLDNGLTLLVLEDHSTPTFTIMLWVPCGGRTEVPGITGISHFIEHLYSMGSSMMGPREVDEYIAQHGGQKNAFTSQDYTGYYESMPIDTFDRILEVEADRFSTLALPADKIDSERLVVMEERRMRYETNKFGALWLELPALAFTQHPYGIPVIGTMEDLTLINREQIVEYHRSHYTTENATYVLVGDFDDDEAIATFEARFGPIARSAAPNDRAPREPEQTAERRRTLTRGDISLPAFSAGWMTVGLDHPDFPALQMLQYYLANGQTGLFERELERGRMLAVTASAYQDESVDPNLFVIQAEAQPGVAIDALERAVYELLEQVKRDGPDPAQMDVARALMEVSFLQGLQTTLDKAQSLGYYQTISGDGYRYLGRYLDRMRAVTPEQVRDVARRYFQDQRRSVVTQLPGAGSEWQSFGEAQIARLPNGLTLLVQRREGVPAAAINVVVKAGSRYDPPGASGSARLTSDMLMGGTQTRDEESLRAAFASLGTALGSQLMHDTNSLSCFVRSADVDDALALIAEVLSQPAFDPAKFEEVRSRLAAQRESARDNPSSLLIDQFYLSLFGADHPYGRPIDGALEEIAGLTVEDVRTFHARAFTPDRMLVTVVGDVDPEMIGAYAALAFGGMAPGEAQPETAAVSARPATERITVVDVPGMSQAKIRIGHPGIARAHEDYDVLLLGNQVLGGSGMTSRLMQDVRTERGLVYGVWSMVFPRELGGAFTMSLDTANRSVGEAIRACLSHVERLQTEEVPAEELGSRQAQFAGELPFRMEKLEDRARLWADAWLYGLGPDYLTRQIDAIRGATAAQVRAAAAEHLRPSEARIVIVGDLSQFRDQLEGLGEIRVLSRQ